MSQEQSDVKANLSANEQDANAVIKTFEGLVVSGEMVVSKRTIVGVLIVGHPVYGEVEEYPVFMPIVLGHSVWGLLGEGYLSSSVSYNYEELYRKSF